MLSSFTKLTKVRIVEEAGRYLRPPLKKFHKAKEFWNDQGLQQHSLIWKTQVAHLSCLKSSDCMSLPRKVGRPLFLYE